MKKKLLNRPAKSPEPKETTKSAVNVKFGKPLFLVTFSRIKLLAAISAILTVGNIIFSFKLFSSSVTIKNHLGHFINMVSKGDGDMLPSLQAVPVLFFIIIDFAFVFLLYKIFSPQEKSKLNWVLYGLIMIGLLLIIIILILTIVVIQHIYSAHEKLHNGIKDAMMNYSANSLYKSQIDRLQIEFQCCGSKKYDEWYDINWYESNLVKNGTRDNSQGNTPFSCCSMSSIFPCIHHDIESTGKVYLYTPELNLSISTKGCYDRLRQKKQEVGWGIVGNFFLYILLQGSLIICLRFLQTAHYENSKFDGRSRLYTIWLFGCYAGKKKDVTPPEPPPVPPELME